MSIIVSVITISVIVIVITPFIDIVNTITITTNYFWPVLPELLIDRMRQHPKRHHLPFTFVFVFLFSLLLHSAPTIPTLLTTILLLLALPIFPLALLLLSLPIIIHPLFHLPYNLSKLPLPIKLHQVVDPLN